MQAVLPDEHDEIACISSAYKFKRMYDQSYWNLSSPWVECNDIHWINEHLALRIFGNKVNLFRRRGKEYRKFRPEAENLGIFSIELAPYLLGIDDLPIFIDDQSNKQKGDQFVKVYNLTIDLTVG